MNNCQENNCKHRWFCQRTGGAICFLILLVALAVGLILGAVYYETILPEIASLIAFTAALAAVIVAVGLYFWYRRRA